MDDTLSPGAPSRRDPYFEHSPALLACLDEGGSLLRLNARWDGRLGWRREELEGRPLAGLVDKPGAQRVCDALARAAQGEEISVDLDMMTRFGTLQPLRWLLRHEPLSQRFFASVEELEPQRRYTLLDYGQLEQQTGLFPEELVYFVGAFKRQVYTILNPDGSIRYESPGILAITGWADDELIGQPSFDLIHPDDRAVAIEVISRLSLGPISAAPMVYRFRRRDGGWVWLESDGVTIYRDGAIHSIVLVSRDVSASLASRRDQATQHAQLDAELRQLRAEIDAQAAHTSGVAQRAEAMRTSDQSVIGWALLRGHDTGWSLLGGNARIEPWGTVGEGGAVTLHPDAEALCLRSRQLQRIVHDEVASGADRARLYACPASGADMMLLVDRPDEDSLEERETEVREVREVVGLTEQARRALHHELRTPLNAILGYTELLEEELPPAHHSDLRRIRQSARLEGAMLSGLLESWRAQGPSRDLALERIELNDLLQEWRALMGSMALQPTSGSPQLIAEVRAVYTDPHKLRLALFGLGHWASRAGRLESLEVRWRAQDPSRDTVCFCVRAAGATAATLEREGAGPLRALSQGLAQRMAEELGASLVVALEPRGAALKLELPQRVSASAELAIDVELDQDTLEEMGEAQGDEQPVILVIDDNAEIHEYLARLLRRQPYHLIFAPDGRQGLAMARQLLPAAILLDVVMPSIDGWSVLAQLKQEPMLARIPVIIHSIIEDLELARQLGAADSLPKPVTREQLLAALDRVCRRTKTPPRGIQGVDEGKP
jgi:PAS domain S-box-containing protein